MQKIPKFDTKRELIVFGEVVDWSEQFGGTKRFSRYDGNGLSVSALKELVEGGYVDPEGRHNNAPTIESFIEFGELAEGYGDDIQFKGYMVAPTRADVRVSITGYDLESPTAFSADVLQHAVNNHRGADEFELLGDYIGTWWD